MTGRFTGNVTIATGTGTGLEPVTAGMILADAVKLIVAAHRVELIEQVSEELVHSVIAAHGVVMDCLSHSKGVGLIAHCKTRAAPHSMCPACKLSPMKRGECHVGPFDRAARYEKISGRRA